MPRSYIPEKLINAISLEPMSPRLELLKVLAEDADPLHGVLVKAMENVPGDALQKAADDPGISVWLKDSRRGNDPQQIRFEIVAKDIDDEIYDKRRRALLDRDPKTPPYDHPALSGIVPDRDLLVPLKDFQIEDGVLSRRGFIFSPAPPLRAVNSQYWSSRVLFDLPAGTAVNVRLDPLLVIPMNEYSASMYKMWVFGKELDWDRIGRLKGKESARWIPDELTSDVAFTDLIWERRDNEVHFECEEIPKNSEERPARYFHSIYDPKASVFVHSDAAVRFYTEDELRDRKHWRLHQIDKAGTRIKLFKIESPLDVGTWSYLVCASYVWNNDIKRYFLGERPFEAEHVSVFTDTKQ